MDFIRNLLKRGRSEEEPFKSSYKYHDGDITKLIKEKCTTFSADDETLEMKYRQLLFMVYTVFISNPKVKRFTILQSMNDICKNANVFNFHFYMQLIESGSMVSMTNMIADVAKIWPTIRCFQILNEPLKPKENIHFVFYFAPCISPNIERILKKKTAIQEASAEISLVPARIESMCKSFDSSVLATWQLLMGALENFFFKKYESSFELEANNCDVVQAETKNPSPGTNEEKREAFTMFFTFRILKDSVSINLNDFLSAIYNVNDSFRVHVQYTDKKDFFCFSVFTSSESKK